MEKPSNKNIKTAFEKTIDKVRKKCQEIRAKKLNKHDPTTRIKKVILDGIYKKYPELAANSTDPHYLDRIRTYYELEHMKSQAIRDWVMIGLIITNLILTAVNIYLAFFVSCKI